MLPAEFLPATLRLKSYNSGKVWIFGMAQGTSCDTCSNYIYDEDYDCYECDVSMDEDEMARFLSQTRLECPYYRSDNEYEVVKHQM